MGFKKGKEKTGGRGKGTPNIITSELKELLNQIVSRELALIPDALKKMNPEKRTELTIKLLAYVLPKPEKNIKIDNQITESPLKIHLKNKLLNL